MKQQMQILVGLPASGKTTYAKQLVSEGWVRINYDDLRRRDPSWKFSREADKLIQQEAYNYAQDMACRLGKNLVIDNTNLSKHQYNKWASLGLRLGLDVQTKWFLTPLDECIARDAKRTGVERVGRPVIERMALLHDMVEFPHYKKLVIVDMDGTMADCSHRQKFLDLPCLECDGTGMRKRSQLIGDKMKIFFSPVEKCWSCHSTLKRKDWDSFYKDVHLDPPITTVVDWVKEIGHDPAYMVCVVSGRPLDRAGAETVEWLDNQQVPYTRLFMRDANDHRPDYMVKQQILDHLPKDRIAFCIDDRPQVIRMWRENGLHVYDVGPGVEF